MEILPYTPLVCFLGCLAAFWWLRLRLPKIPHSISSTAYQSRAIFTEYCLFNCTFLIAYGVWRIVVYPVDSLDDFTTMMAALGLPWLAYFWDYKGKHFVAHYLIAALIFWGLAYTVTQWWYWIMALGFVVFVLASKRYRIFWAEAVVLHMIVLYQIVINYIQYPIFGDR